MIRRRCGYINLLYQPFTYPTSGCRLDFIRDKKVLCKDGSIIGGGSNVMDDHSGITITATASPHLWTRTKAYRYIGLGTYCIGGGTGQASPDQYFRKSKVNY